MSAATAARKSQYKSRGTTYSAKERLRTECLARVRENRLSIIAAVREKQSSNHHSHASHSPPAAYEQAAHDVAAASFNAIINHAMAAQRSEQQPYTANSRSPLSPSSTPDSPSLSLSQQSTASAPSLSPHIQLDGSQHSHTPGSSASAPATQHYSSSVHRPPFPHSLLQSMPADRASMHSMDEKDGGMVEEEYDECDELGGMSAADYMQLMNDMAHELWSEKQLIESEENLSMRQDDGWLDPEGESLSQEYEDYMEESKTQRMYDLATRCMQCYGHCRIIVCSPCLPLRCAVCVVSPCPICRSSYLSFASSSSVSAFAAPLLNCGGCGLSLLCQHCCSTSDVTSLLGDALERHSSRRMCSQQPSFAIEHVPPSAVSLAGWSGPMQQLRLVCAGCELNDAILV